MSSLTYRDFKLAEHVITSHRNNTCQARIEAINPSNVRLRRTLAHSPQYRWLSTTYSWRNSPIIAHETILFPVDDAQLLKELTLHIDALSSRAHVTTGPTRAYNLERLGRYTEELAHLKRFLIYDPL